ncbi:MAG: hypothetical protein SOT80_05670 [Candidatus Pseudoruminococcus sp.]|uniref:hypothetical protein n=1 Tax=Candidatus Pseudoruminococcus sp. TaxID=3101048 RepID=UPI002A7C8FF4|nr:hypothetical protein [Ruminococcus sp.]MDY2782877.1 hypothetical protein [Candidatus Pseudoruminococcus sp.]
MTIRQNVGLFAYKAQYKAKEAIKGTTKRISNVTKRIIKDENGDTNFISIAIILVVVLVLAGVFIAFGNQILSWFNGTVANFWGGKTHKDANKGNAQDVSGSILS